MIRTLLLWTWGRSGGDVRRGPVATALHLQGPGVPTQRPGPPQGLPSGLGGPLPSFGQSGESLGTKASE